MMKKIIFISIAIIIAMTASNNAISQVVTGGNIGLNYENDGGTIEAAPKLVTYTKNWSLVLCLFFHTEKSRII
jgi:hypothetical protein